MQLRKRRKNRGASKLDAEAVAAAAVCSPEASTRNPENLEVAANGSSEDCKNKEAKETDSDDSDADGQTSDISDSELDVDNYYFLQVPNTCIFAHLTPPHLKNLLYLFSRCQLDSGEPYFASPEYAK